MADDIKLVTGDIGRTRDFEFEGVDTLAAVTAIEGHIWRTTAPVSSHVLTAEVIDAAERVVRVHWGDVAGWLPTAAPGTWLLELQAATPSEPAMTNPEGDPTRVIVRAEGG